MAAWRFVVVAGLLAVAPGCEIRDDSCPAGPRDGTLCFDPDLVCTYDESGGCAGWECRCDDGVWECSRTPCPLDAWDAWEPDVSPWDAAPDGGPWDVQPDVTWDVPPPVDAPFEGWVDTWADVAPGCPGEAPVGVAFGCVEDGLRCEYGQECCCGECAPSLVCQCQGGSWGCYYTDFCMRPACPDVAEDVFETVDAPETLDAPDVPPLQPGQCRTDADCRTDDGMWSWCASPDAPQTCGICFRPEATCWTDADCAGTPEAPVCAPSRQPCLCEPGARECMPRCDAEGTTQACDPVTQQCDAATGLCGPRLCKGSGDCATNFRCVRLEDAGTCQRLACAWDPDCDDGWCVNGACHLEPGFCDFPKP